MGLVLAGQGYDGGYDVGGAGGDGVVIIKYLSSIWEEDEGAVPLLMHGNF